MIEKKAYSDACHNLSERNKSITTIHNEKDTLKKYCNEKYVSESPTHRERVHVRNFWLNYDLEMHEYYHEQEVTTKTESEHKYSERKKTWNKEKQKNILLNNNLKSTLSTRSSVMENKEDEYSQEDIMRQGDN
ncbi:MAG: hypothetical protein ABW104_04170 [Candidatus Thiodiazotropha sp. 6PLUC2]